MKTDRRWQSVFTSDCSRRGGSTWTTCRTHWTMRCACYATAASRRSDGRRTCIWADRSTVSGICARHHIFIRVYCSVHINAYELNIWRCLAQSQQTNARKIRMQRTTIESAWKCADAVDVGQPGSTRQCLRKGSTNSTKSRELLVGLAWSARGQHAHDGTMETSTVKR
jgi:hypothetical protein